MNMSGNGLKIVMALLGVLLYTSCIEASVTKWGKERGQGDTEQAAENRFFGSEEESGILLPPDDKYNFVGEDDPTTTTDSMWRSGRNSPLPSTTVISTSGFSIRPGSGGGGTSYTPVGSGGKGQGSSVYINAKPISITTSAGSGYTIKDDSSPFHTKKSDQSTIFVKNNCFGPRCPGSSSQSGTDQRNKLQQNYNDDDWKSYHYVLNQDAKQRYRGMSSSSSKPDQFQRRNDMEMSGTEQYVALSLPFRVGPAVGNYEPTQPPNSKLRSTRRFSRTTTPTTTPGWVKLQPILPGGQYDPFTLKRNNSQYNNGDATTFSPNSQQFANRLGVELNPESFADRWGWSDNNDNKGSNHGSRLPNWLQEMHKNSNGGPPRDADSRNWVKLDPIPVAGVTISKWVPKNTPSSELPSTNWPSRDRPNSIPAGILNPQNSNPQQSTKWWDIIDNINRLHDRPSYGNPHSPPRDNNPGWGSSSSSRPPASSSWDRTPTNAWTDIIYPEGPGSATVSWQQDKQDMSKYASSFPTSLATSSNSNWESNNNNNRRPSTATGSWSADRGSNSNQYSSSNPFSSGNRRYGSASYPNRHTTEDDPRWVLVSNSRKVTVSNPPSYGNNHNNDGQRYRPPFDRNSDFPYYETPKYNNHRVGKDYKHLLKVNLSPAVSDNVVKNKNAMDQDVAFQKVNATLSNLTPVLSHRGDRGSRYRKDSTSTKPDKMPAFMKPYIGDGRAVQNDTLITSESAPVAVAIKHRKGLSINPVYAAVGAGMIPATMAAVLPMMLGRKRRDLRFNGNKEKDNFAFYGMTQISKPHGAIHDTDLVGKLNYSVQQKTENLLRRMKIRR